MSTQVRSSFQKWDAEGSGLILKDELAHVLRNLDPQTTDDELNALFSCAKINYEDKISYERFLSWLFCDIPDDFGKLEVTEFNTAAGSKSLLEVAFTAAVADASQKLTIARVNSYFKDVRKRIGGSEFMDHARRQFAARSSGQRDTATLEEVLCLLDSTLLSTADMAAATRPSPDEIRIAFEAHDAEVGGRGCLDVGAFVRLAQYLQVRVALATLLQAELRVAQHLQELQLNKGTPRERGLWQAALATAKAKALQRFNGESVERYFGPVHAQLSSEQYAEHVRGAVFTKVDANKDGKVSFDEALGLINSSLQCAADLGGTEKPTSKAFREVFTAHDTIVEGWDFMGGDEFLNLMRYLQVQVAEAMMPFSDVIKTVDA